MKKSYRIIIMLFCIFTAMANQSDAGEKFRSEPLNMALQNVFDSIHADADVMTQIRLLTDNEASWYSRWKMIDSAKTTIDTTYFIVHRDVFGLSFLGLLRKKAQEGVKVRLMVDGRNAVWSKGMKDVLQELAGVPNVEMKWYNPPTSQLAELFQHLTKIMAANHDKIIIIDGRLTMIGGRNIGADYFAGKGELPVVYRDTDIVMNGYEMAESLKVAFEEEWGLLKNALILPDRSNWIDQTDLLEFAYQCMLKYMNGEGLINPEENKDLSAKQKKIVEELNAELGKFKCISKYPKFELFYGDRRKAVKVLDKHSCVGVRNDISDNLIKFIDASRDEVFLQSPYLVLSDAGKAAILRAANRGVKVILHTNSGAATDNPFPISFFLNDWIDLLKGHKNIIIKVARGQEDRLHSKTFVFDRQLAFIGSYNLDPLSDTINSEIVAVVFDQEFALMTRLRMENDTKTALEYKIEVGPDGKVKTIFGPEDHTPPSALRKFNLLRKLSWLRPLI
ncbi:MAG: phosphatidylserine/phosphatidylglycerophosphate/cardiolipin synthase family protein [Candidatus Riflebacteria bacterium]|nr:phosphatidylserine/phosphatidylglycerophosphate/cardiolipin synthase family protein [Candidatus Riflebacteria bacterium]